MIDNEVAFIAKFNRGGKLLTVEPVDKENMKVEKLDVSESAPINGVFAINCLTILQTKTNPYCTIIYDQGVYWRYCY